MTTVEGGFVSTNDTELYELMRAKRSHGMARECSSEVFEQYKKDYPSLGRRLINKVMGKQYGGTIKRYAQPRKVNSK